MKNYIVTAFAFILFIVAQGQIVSAQTNGTVVWSQGAMTAKATLKKNIKGSLYVDFKFDYPNGKPGFNVVKFNNKSKFDAKLVLPNGTLINDLASPQSAPGEYAVRVQLLRKYWSNPFSTPFWMEIWIE